MSRIIKSAKVSVGSQIELDTPAIVKTAINRIANVKLAEKSKEELANMYIEEARKKSELFFEEEMQRAHNEGIASANDEANSILNNAKIEADEIINEALTIKNNIKREYKNTIENMENEIVELVLETTKKVIAREIEKPDYIIGIVSEALEKVISKKDTILKVSSSDYDFIINNKEKILLNVEGFGEVEVQKEVSLERGSCRVENKLGIIDGGVSARMQQIEREVVKILNR